ncbi:hypothetical protein BH11CYA1_BH11CYA1_37880 [soil metagenome]
MNCNETQSGESFIQPSKLKDRAFIEIPCPTSWEKMTGDDSVRFCGQCSLNVYNISNLTDKEAEAVFAKGKNGERLCARLYRRPDGTVMTDNCPRALRRIRTASKWLKTKIVACFGLLLSLGAPAQAEGSEKADAKNTTASKCSPLKEKANNEKANQDKVNKDNTAADKSAKAPPPLMHTMGAIRVPTPAEKAELGKVAAPVNTTVAAPAALPVATPTTAPSTAPAPVAAPAATKTDKSKEKAHTVEPSAQIMGRIRVMPAAKQPAPLKNEKAK